MIFFDYFQPQKIAFKKVRKRAFPIRTNAQDKFQKTLKNESGKKPRKNTGDSFLLWNIQAKFYRIILLNPILPNLLNTFTATFHRLQLQVLKYIT